MSPSRRTTSLVVKQGATRVVSRVLKFVGATLSEAAGEAVITISGGGGGVPTTRTISTTAPLTGGGDLSADRTLAVSAATTTAQGVVELATDGEASAGVVVQGNDSRLSDSRTPTGAAGGDLGGTYPSPTVTQARGLRETAGPTTLTMGAVADGELLRRSGTTLVGAAIGVVVQAHNALLAAIAGLSSNGFIARTGSGSAVTRTITGGSGVTVTNGSGVSGNPTISFSGGTGQDDDPTTAYTISVTPSNASLFSRDSGVTARSTANGDTSQYRATQLTGSIADFYSTVGVAQTGWNYTGYISFKVKLITGSSIAATSRYKMGWTNGGLSSLDAETAGRPTMIFRYLTGLSHTNWMCYTQNAAGSEETDSLVAVAINTVYMLEVRLTSTSITYLINGTTVATHTTRIPPTTASMQIQCGNYATGRSLYIIGARVTLQWA